MSIQLCDLPDEVERSLEVHRELMHFRVSKILLISSRYDAFVTEEDGGLAEGIIGEYHELNLSAPPRLIWVSSMEEAFSALAENDIDLVLVMPNLKNIDPYFLCGKIKEVYPSLFISLLSPNADTLMADHGEEYKEDLFDMKFVWRGNTDLLLSIIKNVEDILNVDYDTQRGKVRVIIFVEDSPIYSSSILPVLYKEIVIQTQAVMDESVNRSHRLLMMRARPKILTARNFEDALSLARKFKPYLLSLISDVRFYKEGILDDNAGFVLIDLIKKEFSGMPLLILSSDESNREKALKRSVLFLNKKSSSLYYDIRLFFIKFLAFGDFVFRMDDATEVARASNIREMEKIILSVPDESILYHAYRDHFSTWLMARSEIELASKLQYVKPAEFSSAREIKEYLLDLLAANRRSRQKGAVVDFIPEDLAVSAYFMKIGKGFLGGKARGLAFMSYLFCRTKELYDKYPDLNIYVPKTLAITTDKFDEFMENNFSQHDFSGQKYSDEAIIRMFDAADLPDHLRFDLGQYLLKTDHPIAVRSSSLLEDAQYMPSAGIYKTIMLPNNHEKMSVRLAQLLRAVKLVYASTYFDAPIQMAKTSLHRPEEEKMGVILQSIVGQRHGDFYFPAVSGVAQSYNYYPLSYMKPEEGIAYVAMGLGKTVVEGERALRFSPRYPEFLPQFSTVDDILENCQRNYYALKMTESRGEIQLSDFFLENKDLDKTLVKLDIDDMPDEIFRNTGASHLFSTYLQEDHRIRDSAEINGHRILTFAGILKYNTFPLPELLADILSIGQEGMGCPVEIEFAVNFPRGDNQGGGCLKPEFALLQIRPMSMFYKSIEVLISDDEIADSICFTDNALGNGTFLDISDIVFVKPELFDPACTVEIAGQIARINRELVRKKRRYILAGPGRWGTSDRWLGIPVTWNDISGAGVIIETSSEKLNADSSRGTHFFHNITSLGIGYLTVSQHNNSFINFNRLKALPVEQETSFLLHARQKEFFKIKIDGNKSRGVISL